MFLEELVHKLYIAEHIQIGCFNSGLIKSYIIPLSCDNISGECIAIIMIKIQVINFLFKGSIFT